MSEFNKQIIDEFRANDGKVGGHFEGMNLLLIHTIGAKSGQERINPVAQIADGDQYVIIASKGGAPTNPDWYYNLKANPKVSIEVGTQKFPALAVITEEPERTELFDKMASHYQGFNEYREKTRRVIPVISLIRQ
ncbi:MAG: nitroreductase family deazaflavin-dependent oxidoreductase [Anaerolineales bacterium]|nr:nitroreductase family deazaflavin-dependent oxidoreductase [Anaerolineales bacterium]